MVDNYSEPANPSSLFELRRGGKFAVIGVLFLIFCFDAAFAAPVGQTDEPSTIGGGARPLGMGRAFAAIADDADTIFVNPAGLAGIKGPQIITMFTTLMNEVYYREVSGVVPMSWGTIGAGYISTGVNEIPTIVNSSMVYTDYYDSLFALSYASPLSRFFGYGRNVFMGTNFKIFSRGWSGGINQSAFGWSMDMGMKFIYNPYLNFGLNIQNILPPSLAGVLRWGSGAEEYLASMTKMGMVVKPVIFKGNFLIAFDIDFPNYSSRPVTMHFGSEWIVNKYLWLRCGLDQSVDTSTLSKTSWSPTLGVSLEIARFRFDYAYHPYYNDPEMTATYVSLSYKVEPALSLKGQAVPLRESPQRGRE